MIFWNYTQHWVVTCSFAKGQWLPQLRVALIPNGRNPFGRNLWAVDKGPMKVFNIWEPSCGHRLGLRSLWLSQQHLFVSVDFIVSLKYIPCTEIPNIVYVFFYHFNEEAHFNWRLCLKVKKFCFYLWVPKCYFWLGTKNLWPFLFAIPNQEYLRIYQIQNNWESGWSYCLLDQVILLLCWDYLLTNEKSVSMRYSCTGESVIIKYLWGYYVIARQKNQRDLRTDGFPKQRCVALQTPNFIFVSAYNPKTWWLVHHKPRLAVKISSVPALCRLCCYLPWILS